MPRKLSRRQALQNARFLDALRRTGNVRLAARELGVHRATFTKRRAKHPAFAAEWDAALAFAHANLQNPPRNGEGDHAKHGGGGAPHRTTARETTPEPQLIRLANGRLQLRRPKPRRLTREAEQAFLAALSATANVRLAAAAAGFSHSAFYQRREASPAFAREMRLALQMGYDRIELALIESFDPASARDDAWRSNDAPPIPSMTPDQALQLLHLHQKEARLWDQRPDRKQRRGETSDQWSARRGRKWRAEKAWDREGYTVMRAAEQVGPDCPELEPPAPRLPALDQVTGWSEARPAGEGAAQAKGVKRPGRALFGGWRLEDWEEGD